MKLKHGNSIICSSLLTYGYSEISLEILENCGPLKIITREQHYIDNLKPQYYILSIARSFKGLNIVQKLKSYFVI